MRTSLAAIDTSTIDALKNHLSQLDGAIMDLDADLSAKDTEKGVLGERLRVCREETIPKLNDEILFAESIAVYRCQQ